MTQPSAEATTEALALALIDWFQNSTRYVVAFSGGVDSAVVARAASLSNASVAIATARSAAVSKVDQEDAAEIAGQLGVELIVLDTDELSQPQYVENASNRCFHCKSHLFQTLAGHFPDSQIVTGTNQDDLGDYRPGLIAADNASVRSPLAELRIGKAEVRRLASFWKLPVADKPASPCLASRLAYGVEVTEERLERVEASEVLLRELGLREFRVRVHQDELARIEVHPSDMPVVIENHASLTERLKTLGFRYVTLDMNGFVTGSLNSVLPIETLQRVAKANR